MTYAPRSRAARTVGTYAAIGLETEILGASPERLISLLFRAAQTALAQARHHLETGDVAGRGKVLSKAIDIVDTGLKASVDTDRGGEVARSLIATYDLIIRDLLQANLHADATKLDSAERLLDNVAEAWHLAVDPQFDLAAAPTH